MLSIAITLTVPGSKPAEAIATTLRLRGELGETMAPRCQNFLGPWWGVFFCTTLSIYNAASNI